MHDFKSCRASALRVRIAVVTVVTRRWWRSVTVLSIHAAKKYDTETVKRASGAKDARQLRSTTPKGTACPRGEHEL